MYQFAVVSVKEMVGMKTEYNELGSLVDYEKPFSEEVCRYFFILNG